MRDGHGRRGETGAPSRDAADRLCLWCLCRAPECRRARCCRGNPRQCVGVLREWLGALGETMREGPAFAAAERRTMAPEEKRAFAVWLAAVDAARAKPEPPMSQEDADRLRMDLVRKIEALRKQEEWETANP